MNFVEPIRDKKQLAHIKNMLRGQSRFRDLLLFTVGINTALRVSDLLQLQVRDFFDEQSRLRSRFWIREAKRGKRQEITINTSMREALDEYLTAYPGITDNPAHFIFFSTQNGDTIYTQPLKRGQVWQLMTTLCHQVGLRGNFGTHTKVPP